MLIKERYLTFLELFPILCSTHQIPSHIFVYLVLEPDWLAKNRSEHQLYNQHSQQCMRKTKWWHAGILIFFFSRFFQQHLRSHSLYFIDLPLRLLLWKSFEKSFLNVTCTYYNDFISMEITIQRCCKQTCSSFECREWVRKARTSWSSEKENNMSEI